MAREGLIVKDTRRADLGEVAGEGAFEGAVRGAAEIDAVARRESTKSRPPA